MRSESMFRKRERLTLVALLALGTWLAPSTAAAAGRVALVVGNGAYGAIGTLPNPGNDAADVASALGRLGFDVTTVRDADRVGLNEALRGFTRESAGADVALVFYAGHGLEVDGVNYLVPVDARLERDTDVRFETVALDDVLAATAGASLRVVILDACRNNPLARSMQRTGAARSISRGSFGELDERSLGDETLVAYAAEAGTTAADGTGRNSPYTAALLTYLEQPLEIGILFRQVRARVLASTDRQQRPHEYASLLSEHYLGGVPGSATVVSAAELSAPSATVVAQRETVFWQSIVTSTNPADFEAYLRQYPNGTFRVLAENRLALLREGMNDRPTPSVIRPGSEQRSPPAVFLFSWDDPARVMSQCRDVRVTENLDLANAIAVLTPSSPWDRWALLDQRGAALNSNLMPEPGEEGQVDKFCEGLVVGGGPTVEDAIEPTESASIVRGDSAPPVVFLVIGGGFNIDHNRVTVELHGFEAEEVQRFTRQCGRVQVADSIGLADYVLLNPEQNWVYMFDRQGDRVRRFRTFRRRNVFDDVCEHF